MTEIDYTLPQEVTEYIESIETKVGGVNSVIDEYEKEKTKLSEELDELTANDDYSVKAFKRKSELEKEMKLVEDGLIEAKLKKAQIQDANWSDWNNEINRMTSVYKGGIDKQTNELRGQIKQQLEVAINLIKELNEVEREKTNYANGIRSKANKTSGQHHEKRWETLGSRSFEKKHKLEDFLK